MSAEEFQDWLTDKRDFYSRQTELATSDHDREYYRGMVVAYTMALIYLERNTPLEVDA